MAVKTSKAHSFSSGPQATIKAATGIVNLVTDPKRERERDPSAKLNVT